MQPASTVFTTAVRVLLRQSSRKCRPSAIQGSAARSTELKHLRYKPMSARLACLSVSAQFDLDLHLVVVQSIKTCALPGK